MMQKTAEMVYKIELVQNKEDPSISTAFRATYFDGYVIEHRISDIQFEKVEKQVYFIAAPQKSYSAH